MKTIDPVSKRVEILDTKICEPFIVQLRSDGIVHSHTTSTIDFNIESLKRFNEVMGRMVDYKKVPLIITLDEFSMPSAETRAFWAKKDSCPYSSAEAYVITNVGHKLLGNIYLRFNKPERPKRQKFSQKWTKLLPG